MSVKWAKNFFRNLAANSGIQAAHGIAAGLGVELVHAIKKTGKVSEMRTFIAPTQEELIAWRRTPKDVLDEINDAIVAEAFAGKVVKGKDLEKALAGAGKRKVKELRRRLGANSLTYTNITDLIKAIGLPGKLCLACFNGVYPEGPKHPLRGLAEHEARIRRV